MYRQTLSVVCGAFLLLLLSLSTTNAQVVRFETSMGDFDVQLFPDAAPNTVDNFMNYVSSNRYDDTIVHRVVSEFVIQGGGYNSTMEGIPSDPPIDNEHGTPNTRGTIAMAKTSDPDSATSQWFINIEDNLFLDDPRNSGGFTVFGEVVGDGMNIVDAISELQYARGQVSPFTQLPVTSLDGALADNLVVVNNIFAVPEPNVSPVVLSLFLLFVIRIQRNRR